MLKDNFTIKLPKDINRGKKKAQLMRLLLIGKTKEVLKSLKMVMGKS